MTVTTISQSIFRPERSLTLGSGCAPEFAAAYGVLLPGILTSDPSVCISATGLAYVAAAVSVRVEGGPLLVYAVATDSEAADRMLGLKTGDAIAMAGVPTEIEPSGEMDALAFDLHLHAVEVLSVYQVRAHVSRKG